MDTDGASDPPDPDDSRQSSRQPTSPTTERSSTNSPSPIAESLLETKGGTSKGRRRKAGRKPTGGASVWPCKINGCGKEFAREADLKRHQRTTKTHNTPSFSCPQCEASFSRTDALRRHQKSRHDGVVLDPIDQAEEGEMFAQSSGTAPSTWKGKEKANNVVGRTAQQLTNCGRPASYYRDHCALTTPYTPPQLHYLYPGTQITHPTSATRTGPPWPSYFHHASNYPSPYYRPHTVNYSPTQPPASSTSSSSPPSCNSQLHDPSVQCAEPSKEITAEEVVAAVEAALMQTASKSQSDGPHTPSSQRARSLDIVDHPMEEGLSLGLRGFGSYGDHKPMENLITEDGEPMLNPAELLTQESLAESPPPC